jgi:hypothetical protein
MLLTFDFLIDSFAADVRSFVFTVIGVVALFIVARIVGSVNDQKAAKFKEDNPDVATIWLTGGMDNVVYIDQVDGGKVYQQKNGVYILPGDHVLSLSHRQREEDYSLTSKRRHRTTRFRSKMKVSLVARGQYTLQFGDVPGIYSLVEGRSL